MDAEHFVVSGAAAAKAASTSASTSTGTASTTASDPHPQASQATNTLMSDATQAPCVDVGTEDEATAEDEGDASDINDGGTEIEDNDERDTRVGEQAKPKPRPRWTPEESLLLMKTIVELGHATAGELKAAYLNAVAGTSFAPRGENAPVLHFAKFKTRAEYARVKKAATAAKKWTEDETWAREENDLMKTMAEELREKQKTLRRRRNATDDSKLLTAHWVVFLEAMMNSGVKHHTRTKEAFEAQWKALMPRQSIVAASPGSNATTDVDESPAPTTSTKPSRPGPQFPSLTASRFPDIHEETKTEEEEEEEGDELSSDDFIIKREDDDGPMVAATAASGPTRRKRRRRIDDDDDEVVIVRITKRQRAEDAVQEDDLEEDTTADSPQTAKSLSAHERVNAVFTAVVERLMQGETEAQIGTQWTTQVGDKLNICEELMVMACELANKLLLTVEAERETVQRDTLQRILDVLDKCSVGDRFTHSEDSIERQWQEVKGLFAEAQAQQNPELIPFEEITIGLEECLNAKAPIQDSIGKAQLHLDHMLKNDGDTERLDASSGAASGLQQRMRSREELGAALIDVIKNVDDYQSTFFPHELYMEDFKRYHQWIIRAKADMRVEDALEALRQKVVPRLKESLERFAVLRLALDHKITLYVETQFQAMTTYFEHHTRLQTTKAHKAKKKQTLIDTFNGRNKATQETIINTCKVTIEESAAKMSAVVEAHRDLWHEAGVLFSAPIQQKFESLYVSLLEMLTEDHNAMLRAQIEEFTSEIRTQRATSPASPTAAPPTRAVENDMSSDDDEYMDAYETPPQREPSSDQEQVEPQPAAASSWFKSLFGR